jgi:uncharacterized protein YndB with AHSA1/START domain
MSTKTSAKARVSRRFDATAERVFDAWLSCGMIEQWMFGPAVRDEEIVRLSIDPREGGAFSFVVDRGGEEIDHIGRYLEIDRPRRLMFTWTIAGAPTGSRVLVEVAEREKGCEVSLTHELHPDWAHFVPRSEEGWRHMLDALAEALK